MTDTLMSILGIALAVLVMFIIPTIAIAGEYDEIAQTTVEVAVADFVNTIAEKGKITEFDYNELIQKISATGNSFDVQIELQVMDDNPERKTVTTSQTLNEKGENLQYSVYTQDITDKIREKITNDEEGEYNLKKDDYIIVTVKNTNITIGTAFKNFFYGIVGKDAYVIGTSSSALVTNSGTEEQEEVHSNIVEEKFQEKYIKITKHIKQTITTAERPVVMMVILDSEPLCMGHVRVGATQQSMQKIYQQLNNTSSSFYLGFIQTSNPTRIVAECSKNNPPNTSQLSTESFSGNYAITLKNAISKIERESEGTNKIKILVFMSWTGVSPKERQEANTVLQAKKDSIDKMYTMGCCRAGSLGDNIKGLWDVTLGSKYGGHLPNGMIGGDIENMLTSTETIEKDEIQYTTSKDEKILLANLDISKDIILIVNNREYSYKDSPFNGNVLTVTGGKYYLDLKKIATAIGKDDLNDVSLEIKYSATA